MSDFLPASATSAKARKHAQKQANKPKKNTSTALNKAKGKATSTLLLTQPKSAPTRSSANDEDDSIMSEFERRPLIDENQPTTTKKSNTTQAEADAAMHLDGNHASDDDEDDAADDSIVIDPSSLSLPTPVVRTRLPLNDPTNNNSLSFAPISHVNHSGLTQRRKVGIPPHRMSPLKRDWIKIYSPLVEECGLQVRMNTKRRFVEMKTSKHTPSTSSLTRASDFLAAYALGFAVEDAIALLRLEELYVESFEVKDVKTLHGDHLSRAIGRIAGHEGKTRFVIENASRTRIVLADTKIHILGTFSNIKIARDAICALILGSPPGKIYAGLRQVASRSRERF